MANFLNCDSEEIFFTYNATYGINYLAYFLSLNYLSSEDEIILTEMEHHANLLPFFNLSKVFGFKLKLWKMNDNLELDIKDLENLLTNKTKLLCVTHMSNVLGVVNNIYDIVKFCKENGIMVLIDGAQGIVHSRIDLSELGTDFYVFSTHKIYGPFGLGVVYVNRKHFGRQVPPFSGGSMVRSVFFNDVSYLGPPMFFEPGTQAFSQIFTFKYSIEYLKSLGLQNIEEYEIELTKYFINELNQIDFIQVYGYNNVSNKRFAIVPFNVKGIHPHDVSFLLDQYNILIRVGHHCAQLIHHKLNVPATCRVSFSFYNTKEEVDNFIQVLWKIRKFLYL
ncbi:MAG: aminotransferase class V-fold PLP-dependent enzyme [bacterium]|nr:aminotransferase class V-fold PLP-dependent enzyme [bacterium]